MIRLAKMTLIVARDLNEVPTHPHSIRSANT
jgi:hypothetical protein